MKKPLAIALKSADDVERIRDAGRIIAGIFASITSLPLEVMTTLELDRHIETMIRAEKALAAFKTVPGYGHASCISLNSEVLHGIPGKKKRIHEGDLVKVDVGVVKNGYFADACRTYIAGSGGDKKRELLVMASREALDLAIGHLYPGNRMGDIGQAIESRAKRDGFSVVRTYMGHGVGFKLHEAPPVPSVGKKGTGLMFQEGMVLAIEPMLTAGKADVRILDDGWTVVTVDGSDSAEFEDTVAITASGPLVLTR